MKFKNILGDTKHRANIENIQSDFVSIASHQLRTPLSAVKWYTEMLLSQKFGPLTEKQLNYLKEMYRANERAINLVNDLLDVSHIQQGEIHLELRLTKLENLIHEIINDLDTLIKSSHVTVDFEIIGGPLPEFELDREKLKRVVINLLANAIKYSPDKERIKIILERSPKYLKITVKDFGVGIPKADQKKIFNKFFRATNVLKLVPEGTGLGLFISKSLVKAMGGNINIKSDIGKGTEVFFTLPLKS